MCLARILSVVCIPCTHCDPFIQHHSLLQLLSTFSNFSASMSSSKHTDTVCVVARGLGKDENGTRGFKNLNAESSMLTSELLKLTSRTMSPCQVPVIISGQLLRHNKNIIKSLLTKSYSPYLTFLEMHVV